MKIHTVDDQKLHQRNISAYLLTAIFLSFRATWNNLTIQRKARIFPHRSTTHLPKKSKKNRKSQARIKPATMMRTVRSVVLEVVGVRNRMGTKMGMEMRRTMGRRMTRCSRICTRIMIRRAWMSMGASRTTRVSLSTAMRMDRISTDGH